MISYGATTVVPETLSELREIAALVPETPIDPYTRSVYDPVADIDLEECDDPLRSEILGVQ